MPCRGPFFTLLASEPDARRLPALWLEAVSEDAQGLAPRDASELVVLYLGATLRELERRGVPALVAVAQLGRAASGC